MRFVLIALAFTFAISCAKTQKPAVATAITPPAPLPQLEAKPVEEAKVEVDGWAELQGTLKSSTVLFDFNSDHLSAGGQQALQKVAQVLRKYPKFAIRVEGNCDERGTEEYNLMLGQRRAEVAKRYLVNLGVGDNQVQTMSYGALKPAVKGNSEEAYAKNRRDELVPTE